MGYNPSLSFATVTGFGTGYSFSYIAFFMPLGFCFLLPVSCLHIKVEEEEIFGKIHFFILGNASCVEEWFPETQSKFKLHLLFDTTVGEHKKIAPIY